MVIFHVLIIKNHPKLFSNYYPKYKFWVIYPFLCIYQNLYMNSLSLNITRLYERKWKCSHFFGNHVSDRSNNFWQKLYDNYHTQLYERRWQYSHYLGIIFLIESIISVIDYMVITIKTFKFFVTAMWLVVRTDLIAIYDIIIFNIEVFYWIIYV